jgi:hypothetical protein
MLVRTGVPTIHDIWKGEIRLESVSAAEGFRLLLKYRDGAEYALDCSDFVGCGGISDPLADPAYFALVSLGEGGHFIEWPNGYDIGSDTLRWDPELQLRGLTRADVPED